jgi:phosphoribosylformylglycinamidine (FGAM) synthase-like enzyme
VSLYNETGGVAVFPTPVVGALGLLDDVDAVVPMGFQREGDTVLLLGRDLHGDVATLAGSEYLKLEHDLIAGRPVIDLDLEARVQRLVLDLARRRVLASAHDCSRGGLAVGSPTSHDRHDHANSDADQEQDADHGQESLHLELLPSCLSACRDQCLRT